MSRGGLTTAIASSDVQSLLALWAEASEENVHWSNYSEWIPARFSHRGSGQRRTSPSSTMAVSRGFRPRRAASDAVLRPPEKVEAVSQQAVAEVVEAKEGGFGDSSGSCPGALSASDDRQEEREKEREIYCLCCRTQAFLV
jgi:hypothetical protein